MKGVASVDITSDNQEAFDAGVASLAGQIADLESTIQELLEGSGVSASRCL